jgi:hypothetical protein
MVNVIYGEHSRQIELAGRTVADVREMFESEFDLSDRAQANLNGRWLKRKLEAETELCSEDELYFEEKSRRPMVLLGAFLLVLAITGGMFAYTQTTQLATITVGGGGTDFVTLTANATPNYTVLGNFRGTIPTAIMFDVTRDSNYTGDLVVDVYLNNPDDLETDYKSWMMRVQLTDAAGNPVDTQAKTEIISLDKPFATFEIDVGVNMTSGTGYSAYIECDGGSYKTFGHGWITPEQPQIYANVVQAGDH